MPAQRRDRRRGPYSLPAPMDAADLAFAGAARQAGLIRGEPLLPALAAQLEAVFGWPARRPAMAS